MTDTLVTGTLHAGLLLIIHLPVKLFGAASTDPIVYGGYAQWLVMEIESSVELDPIPYAGTARFDSVALWALIPNEGWYDQIIQAFQHNNSHLTRTI
jgi:hypothetical protein